MASCPKCTAKVLPDQRLCRACGEPLPDPEARKRDSTDALVGTTIAGNFEIIALLGEGAMGRVYRARQISLDKQVAIKVLHKHLAADPTVAKRFHREARAASRLSHPNALQIIDFDAAEDGTLYIAMELLDGDDLLTMIEEQSPIPPARIANIMRQVLLALDEAHHCGIIHRDLKPENVIVLSSRGGTDIVKVCDFGIAKIQEPEGERSITVTGFVCGTPEYMAPEQARGEDLDARADLYATGVVLYQMLTGELPFAADTALGVITKHLMEQPVPPQMRRPDLGIPDSLQEICLKAMSKDREHRYASAADMCEAVSAVGVELGVARASTWPDGGPTTRRTVNAAPSHVAMGAAPGVARRSTFVLVAAAVIVVALLGGALAFAFGGTAGEPGAVGSGADGPGADAQASSIAAAVAVAAPATTMPLVAAPSDAGSRSNESQGDSAGSLPPTAAGREADAKTTRSAPARRDQRASAGGDRSATATKTEPTQPAATFQASTAPERSPGELAYDEGRRLFLANSVLGAIARFEEAARFMPRNAQVYRQLGRAYMRVGDVSRGVSSYRRYLELSPQAADRSIIERIIEQSGS